MSVRTLVGFVVVSLAFLASALVPTAWAQCGSWQSLSRRSLPGGSYAANQQTSFVSSEVPGMRQLATQSFDRVEARYDSCAAHRQQNEYWASRSRVREAEANERQANRSAIPVKQWTEDELAMSKFRLARQLWQAGNPSGSRRFLESLIREFPKAQAANNARLALARM